jgi:hypothetical protein
MTAIVDFSKYTNVIVDALILSRKTSSDEEFESSVKKMFAPFTKKERKSGKAASKDKKEFKRPKSPYMFFMQEKRVDVPAGTKFGEVAKIIATQWSALSESEKDKYVQLSVADKARYEEDKKKSAANSGVSN